MTTANVKGGFKKSIQIIRNHDHESTTMLKNEFLKNTEKYVVQVQNFFTTAASRINTHSGVHFAIRRFGAGGGTTPAFPNYYRQSDYEFTGGFHSVVDFVFRLQHFFHNFGYLFERLSLPVGDLVGANPTALAEGLKATSNLNFFRNFQTPDVGQLHGTSNIGWSQTPEQGHLCSVSINSDNKLEFVLTPLFLANLYIVVSPGMQEMLGFNPEIFYFFDTADTWTDSNGDALFQANTANFFDEIDYREITPDTLARYSAYSVDNLDSRLSLDITCTFPNSNKITVFNGKEEHEYVLARFILNDYKTFRTNTISDDDGLLGTRSITENMTIGLEDLTRGNPNMESNFLLPGSIQLFKLALSTRYFESGKIISKPTDLEDGFWSLKLLFSKKV